MVAITLPDKSVRSFDKPITGAELAASIGAGLAKAALAVKVDGVLRDIRLPITATPRLKSLPTKARTGWKSSAMTPRI